VGVHEEREPVPSPPEKTPAPRLAPAPSLLLRLQRTAGNAAVGRVLARQESATLAARDATKRQVYYDRSNFKDRFDGIVDRGRGRIVLVMNVSLSPAPQLVNQHTGTFDDSTMAMVGKFKTDFESVVERYWSGAHALKPLGPLDSNLKYETKVDVVFTDSNPHAELWLHPKTIDAETGEAARSCATPADGYGNKGVGNFQEGDNVEKERKWKYKGEDYYFYGNTSAHEFGHLLGLDHIHHRGSDDNAYGVTPEQSMDIMGRGGVVSPRDMEPFLQIAKRYGRDVAPEPKWNQWSVVDSG
jgi:hypothetical protein